MEVEKILRGMDTNYRNDDDDDDDVPLPGFRFHPTDEELVGFYLRRKVEKRPISIELIKQIDIYKYDPWDLPKGSSNVGDKEWYFFCKRGRKYRNSVRPNRVTGSGFWKATGIDKPIYSSAGGGGGGGGGDQGHRRDCIGLKKSLVYYRGSAGKGTKTDWMLHEFRLPPHHHDKTHENYCDPKTIPDQEAEVWTLCRIFKRNVCYRNKCIPADWRSDVSAKRNVHVDAISSKTCTSTSTTTVECDNRQGYNISFRAPVIRQNIIEKKPSSVNYHVNETNQSLLASQLSSISQAPSTTASFLSPDMNEFFKYGDWDELRSVVQFAPFLL